MTSFVFYQFAVKGLDVTLTCYLDDDDINNNKNYYNNNFNNKLSFIGHNLHSSHSEVGAVGRSEALLCTYGQKRPKKIKTQKMLQK